MCRLRHCPAQAIYMCYATLSTGLLRYTRNETERYAKVAARTKSAGDTCTKNNVIASKRSAAWQSSLFYVTRSAQNFYRGGAPAETNEL